MPESPSRPSDAAVTVTAGPARMLLRGLLRHCARCGSGRLFRHWFRMAADCPRCGYHFEREEGFFLGAFVINFAVVLGSLMVFLAVGFAVTLPDPPTNRLAAIGLAVSVLVPLFCYPFSKTVWTAVDLIMRKGFGESYRNVRQPGYGGRPASVPSSPSGADGAGG